MQDHLFIFCPCACTVHQVVLSESKIAARVVLVRATVISVWTTVVSTNTPLCTLQVCCFCTFDAAPSKSTSSVQRFRQGRGSYIEVDMQYVDRGGTRPRHKPLRFQPLLVPGRGETQVCVCRSTT